MFKLAEPLCTPLFLGAMPVLYGRPALLLAHRRGWAHSVEWCQSLSYTAILLNVCVFEGESQDGLYPGAEQSL